GGVAWPAGASTGAAAQQVAGDTNDAPMAVTAEELRKCRRVTDSGGKWWFRRSFMESLAAKRVLTNAYLRLGRRIHSGGRPTIRFQYTVVLGSSARRSRRPAR